MPLDATREAAVNIARAVRRQAYDKRWDSMTPQLIAYRGEAPCASIVFPELNDDTLLRGFALASWGFDADALSLIFEGWTTELTTNPATAEPWRSEDFELFDAAGKGWATQALVIVCTNRAGDIKTAELPYVIDGDLRWGAPLYGNIHLPQRWDKLLTRTMNAPSGAVMLPGITDDFSRIQRDVWTADHLQSSAGCSVALISTSGEHTKALVMARESGVDAVRITFTMPPPPKGIVVDYPED